MGTGGHGTCQHVPSSHTVPPFHRQGDLSPLSLRMGLLADLQGPQVWPHRL